MKGKVGWGVIEIIHSASTVYDNANIKYYLRFPNHTTQKNVKFKSPKKVSALHCLYMCLCRIGSHLSLLWNVFFSKTFHYFFHLPVHCLPCEIQLPYTSQSQNNAASFLMGVYVFHCVKVQHCFHYLNNEYILTKIKITPCHSLPVLFFLQVSFVSLQNMM